MTQRFTPSRRPGVGVACWLHEKYSAPSAKLLSRRNTDGLAGRAEPAETGEWRFLTIEAEINVILRDLNDVEANYGEDIVTLTVSCRYAARVLANDRISKYLRKYEANLMGEVQALLTAVESEKGQFTRTDRSGGQRTVQASQIRVASRKLLVARM